MTLPVTAVFYLYIVRNVHSIDKLTQTLGKAAGNSAGVLESVYNISKAKRSD
jgi:hypothetical protein